ncbi:uncharacterized protein LOC120079551 [Benincasa hispida]|uniref:uncharacterized protein LOC120079551 n=1 Tax=Benincasa hispida TaxID=102211 RepID=UPI001900DF40|nr:uncharacterized protein LOC120079551 [Benincasa hispida]
MIVAKESYNREEDTSIITEDPYQHDEEEAVETLSLCDLPIYSDESNCDDYSKPDDDQSASFDNEDTFFEFFSDDFSVSNSTYSGSDNIIFCGKLIPYKQPNDSQNKGRITSEKISEKNCLIQTKSHSFNGKKSSVIDSREIGYTRTTRGGIKSFDPFSISLPKNPEYVKRKRRWKLEKCELPEERAMILQPSPAKSRWFVFLFGSARFPKEMELSEMRTRQRRSSRTAMFRPSEERKVAAGRSNGKKTTVQALWKKILRAMVIGCSSSSDQNGAVKASFRPISVV